ncbi:hypothetical protein ACP4OV_012658 [Aristida adscensionis]
MQCRRQRSISGELDVFGAARYFAGITEEEERAVRLITQLKTTTQHDKRMEGSFRGGHEPPLLVLHDDGRDPQLGLRGAKPSAAGKMSKLTAFLGFMMSQSPESSFRKKPPPTAAAGDEPAKSSNTRESSSDDASVAAAGMQDFGHDDVDLGVVIGDRRLQGVRVVRGSGGEERWVVTCGAFWEMESNDKMRLDDDAAAATSIDRCHDQADDGEDCASHGNLESDCSSDLFDLDLDEERY